MIRLKVINLFTPMGKFRSTQTTGWTFISKLFLCLKKWNAMKWTHCPMLELKLWKLIKQCLGHKVYTYQPLILTDNSFYILKGHSVITLHHMIALVFIKTKKTKRIIHTTNWKGHISFGKYMIYFNKTLICQFSFIVLDNQNLQLIVSFKSQTKFLLN